MSTATPSPEPAGAPAPRGGGAARLVARLVLLLVVALVGLEVVLRVAPGFSRAELDPIAAELAKANVEPHPYLAYANKPGYRKDPTADSPHQVSHNALGFRGPETTWEKPDGRLRVLCLGGSSTYGHGPSSDATTWPAQLESMLRAARPGADIEVINAGCRGYSTFESLINLGIRCVDLRPDVVVVYHSINDARCALYPGVVRDNTHWRAVWPVREESRMRDVLESSYVYLAWRRYLTDWWETRRNLGSYVIRDFGKYADDYAQPTGEQGFASFHRNVVSIVELCRDHGAQPVLVTQGIDGSDLDGAGSKDLQMQAMDRMTGTLRAVAVERSVPLVDAREVLEAEAARQVAERGADGIFTHEVHLTDAGAELLARTIAEALIGAGIVP